MQPESTNLTVFARDYPEARLRVEVKPDVSSPPDQDETVKRVAKYMWGANCHFALVMTPSTTYVLRDDFSTTGPGAMHVTDVLPTTRLLGRLIPSGAAPTSVDQLERIAHDWLQRLTTAYESALPDDPEVVRALFPDLVGAVADGRIVTGVAA